MELFFDVYWVIKLYLIISGNLFICEWIQSLIDCVCYDDIIKCILCVCCIISCLVFWYEGSYFGLVVIVNVYCFIFDSCDEVVVECFDIFNEVDGVWCCCIMFNCIEFCLWGIEVIKVIQEVKCVLMFIC